MSRRSGPTKFGLFSIFLCLLFVLVATGCDGTGEAPPSASLPPVATPTVDLEQAREIFQSGGALTYDEVRALRHEMVGDYEERVAKGEFEQYLVDEKKFGTNLEKCRLKETIGWFAGVYPEVDKNYKPIPDKNQVGVFAYNPYYGFGKNLSGGPELALLYLTDKEVEQLKLGQRLKFSGDLLLQGGSVAVRNVQYTLLEELAAPAPTADELKDLHVTLRRTMCLGACPQYVLTIEADGKVSFEGRAYTRGTFTSTLSTEQVVELASEIKKADFFSLKDEYTANFTDVPDYTLTVEMGGQEKRVFARAVFPRRLNLLMDRIDEIVGTRRWLRGW